MRCGECQGCTEEDCGTRVNCEDTIVVLAEKSVVSSKNMGIDSVIVVLNPDPHMHLTKRVWQLTLK